MRGANVLVNNDAIIHVELAGESDIKPSTFDFAMDLLTPGGGYEAPGQRVVAAADVSYHNVEALFDNGVVEIAPMRNEELSQSQLALAAGATALSR